MKASSARRATSRGVKAVDQVRRDEEATKAEVRERVITSAEEQVPKIYAKLEEEIKAACAKGETTLETSISNWWSEWLIPWTIAPILRRRLEDDGFTVEKCTMGDYEFQGSDESPVETHHSVRLCLNWRKS